jgi:ribonuclease J
MTVGPFTITPFLVDHSAYDAYAILVEAEGAALFYTGDLRAHGRKAGLFHKLLRTPPPHVDVLLMEGTTIGRTSSERVVTEADLEEMFVALFRQTKGMPLVWCSGQNLDRIVTIYRACLRTDRQLIVDMYTADVLRATGNQYVPQAEWERMKVFLPASQRRQIKRRRAFALARSYGRSRIFTEELAAAAAKSVMLFRPSMMQDVEQAGCLADARLIFSMWSGYVKDEKSRPFLEWLDRHGIPLDECHTSGHASVRHLVELRQTFATAPVVPIHSNHPELFDGLFGNVRRYADGEWWEVEATR